MANKITKPKDKQTVNIDVTKYVNTETGEVLGSEVQGMNLKATVVKEGDYIILQSDDFLVMDTRAFDFIKSELSTKELSSILLMAQDLKTPLNIVYNNNIPHTNETLQDVLGFASRAMFHKLIKKLLYAGVLYQVKGKIRGSVRVIYMFNPFLARKRKTISKELGNIFENFGTIEEPKYTNNRITRK